jgi:hypothetical protein
LTAVATAANAAPSLLACQSADPIIPADFEACFPDDVDAAQRLNKGPGQSGEKTAASDLIPVIRQGLRRADRQPGPAVWTLSRTVFIATRCRKWSRLRSL